MPGPGWIAKLGYNDNGNRDQLKYYLDGTLNGDVVSIGYSYNCDNRLVGFSCSGRVTFGLSNTTIDGLGRGVSVGIGQGGYSVFFMHRH